MSKEKAKIMAIGFDLDGTILDNTLDGFNKIQETLRKIDLPEADPELIRLNWGKPFEELILIICSSVGAPHAVNDFMESEKQHSIKYAVDIELMVALWELRKNGHYLFLITSRTEESLQSISAKTGLNLDVFNFYQTSTTYKHVKPSGKVFNVIAANAKSRQFDKIYYFGDTVNYDMQAAINAPIPINFVGIVSGVSTQHEFFRAGANELVDGVRWLPDKLYSMVGIQPVYSKHQAAI